MTSQPTGGSSSRRVRLGIVGLGAVAQAVHLPILDRLADRFAVTALCDLSPTLLAALGERYRVPADARFARAEALLGSDRVDAVVILSSGSHGRLALDAARRGLPTFVEKPLAFTLAEVDAIAEVGPAAERIAVGYMKLWDPAVRRALGAIERARRDRGVDVRAIEVTVLHPSSERQLWQAWLLPPARDLPAGAAESFEREADALRQAALGEAAGAVGRLYTNILLGSVVHELALVRAFAGDPVSIDAADTWPPDAWPPSVSAQGRLANGGRLTIGWHYLPDYGAYREIVRVILDDATIELEFPSPYYLHAPTRLTIVEPDEETRRDTSWLSVREAFEEELLGFHELVVEGTPPHAGIRAGRADIVTCLRLARRLADAAGVPIGGEAATIDAVDPPLVAS